MLTVTAGGQWKLRGERTSIAGGPIRTTEPRLDKGRTWENYGLAAGTTSAGGGGFGAERGAGRVRNENKTKKHRRRRIEFSSLRHEDRRY